MTLKVPASVDTEEALLGSLFLYPETFRLAFEENLVSGDFFVPANKKIYQVMLDLNHEEKPVDVATVVTRLQDIQELNSVGGVDYIMHLTDLAISSANSRHYITNLKEKSLLRRLIEVSERIKQRSYQGQHDPIDVLNEAESLILSVSRDRKTTEFKNSKETFDELIERINELKDKSGLTGVASGFGFLDNITNGFQKGDLIIIAARPSVGKTAFALNIASETATKYDSTVALFSLEMPAIHLAMRMMAANSSVEISKLRKGRGIENDEWGRIDVAKNRLEKAKIFIDDSPTIKVNEIFAKCRKLKDNQKLDLIIIDYLQLIAPSVSKGDNRQLEVSEISRSLKQMARELEVPVIALSQLSRTVEKGKDRRRPILSDLRESGAIEQDADIVMFLHQAKEKENNKSSSKEKEREIELIIAKHRNGPTGSLLFSFETPINRFYAKMRTNIEEED
ncbi:MAG: replicative DNA helicase [Erysipelotrichaceae bacterium]|jgi:replicative DNA helicase